MCQTQKPGLNPVVSITPVPMVSQNLHRKRDFMEPVPMDEYCDVRPGNQMMHPDTHCILSDCSIQFEF